MDAADIPSQVSPFQPQRQMKMHLLSRCPLSILALLSFGQFVFPAATYAQPARQPAADAQAQPARQAEAQAQQGRQGGDTAFQAPTAAQLYLRENYTKYEYKIPMRDGVHLVTAVYIPKDDDKSYPILLTRTPYTVKPYGEDVYPNPGGSMNHYAKEKFIFALQDVRGKNGSEGTFVHMARSSTCGRSSRRSRLPRTSTNPPMPTTPSIGS
jgi:hypothetical protein